MGYMNYRLLLIAPLLYLAAACNNTSQQNTTTESEQTDEAEDFTPPAPGTIVASASMPVKDDLNEFSFKVIIVANEYTKKGTYTIKASYGPNDGESMFTLPRGAAHLKPAIKRGEGYTYIVGFMHDDKFYDYYEVKAIQQNMTVNISIKNIKAYTLQ